VLDQLERLVHRGEHPEPEQVELDQLERLDVALVELDDDAIDHRRPLDRGDVDERGRGHEHPARMDREVAREAVDPGAELEPALPVREPTVEPPRAWGGGSGSTRATDDWAPRHPGRAARRRDPARPGAQLGPWRGPRYGTRSVARGGGFDCPLSGSIRLPSMSGGATKRSVSAL
jgi:hypothetical protein